MYSFRPPASEMSLGGPDHVAPREEEGDDHRRITYSRESLLSVRRAASEDNELLAGIDACKNKVEAESGMWEQPPGSKSKICMRFFSTGCQFGDGCLFLHDLPGNHPDQETAVAKKMDNLNLGLGDPAPARASTSTAPATVKTRLCKNHNTPKGCKWGDMCHFAHSEGDLGKPMGPGSSFKTRLCLSFAIAGSCTFGGRCHFAHGQDELLNTDSPQ